MDYNKISDNTNIEGVVNRIGFLYRAIWFPW